MGHSRKTFDYDIIIESFNKISLQIHSRKVTLIYFYTIITLLVSYWFFAVLNNK